MWNLKKISWCTTSKVDLTPMQLYNTRPFNIIKGYMHSFYKETPKTTNS